MPIFPSPMEGCLNRSIFHHEQTVKCRWKLNLVTAASLESVLMVFVSLKQTHLFETLRHWTQRSIAPEWGWAVEGWRTNLWFFQVTLGLVAGSWIPLPSYWRNVRANPWLLFLRGDLETGKREKKWQRTLNP